MSVEFNGKKVYDTICANTPQTCDFKMSTSNRDDKKTKQLKIAIISDAWHPQLNGVVRTYEHLKEDLERFGHDVYVIGPADFNCRLPMPGYHEIELVPFSYRRLKKLLDSYAPDKIHIAAEGPLGWAARKYCQRHKRNFTSAYHTQFPDYAAKRVSRPGSLLYKLIYKWGISYVKKFHAPAKAVLVATPSLEEQLKRWNFKPRLHHYTRGVNLDIFHPAKKGWTAPQQLQKLKRPIALYVGRIAIEKNLEAFLSMKWEGTKLLVGDGPSREYLQKKYPDAVFVGTKQKEELADHFRASDVFVFPSKTDTFGIVLIEALACGLTIAGYNVTGPKDIITQDWLGAVDDNDLSAAAHSALKHANEKDREKRAAHVREYYSWEHAARQFEDSLINIPGVVKR